MGTKSSKSKQRKGATKGKAKQQNAPLPDLPVEIIAVIAEHLIGQYAFGTAASVNILSKEVHRETLPVLYESFFCEHYEQLPYYREGNRLPDGLRYTKFAHLTTKNPNAQQIADKLINLIMTVSVDKDPQTEYANECDLGLYKPISSHTAFRIAETPMRQPLRNHALCKIRGVGIDFLYFPARQQKAFLETASPQECATEAGKPPVRSCAAIRSVTLYKGADFLPFPNAEHFTTDLCLGDTALVHDGDICGERDLIDTAIELLKLVGLNAHPAQHALHEKKMTMQRLLEERGQRLCGCTRRSPRWHLGFSVSRRGLEDMISKLGVALPLHPAIVKNRCLVKVTDKIDLAELQSYIYTFHSLYSPYITSTDMVIPTSFSEPLATPLRLNTVTQLVPLPLEQQDPSQPPKKVKWTGRVKVLAGEGKSVTVETDFQDLALHYPPEIVVD